MLLIFYTVALVVFYMLCAGANAVYERWCAWTQKHLH